MDGGYCFRAMWRRIIRSSLQANIIAMDFYLNISIKIQLEGTKKS